MFDAKNKGSKGTGLIFRSRAASVLLLVVLAAFSLLPLSCSRSFSRGLKLPTDPAVASELGWALVTTAYARLKVSPDGNSADSGALRAGEIFICRQRRIDPEGSEAGGFWYECREASLSGWVRDRDIAIFASEALAKASRAAAKP